MHSVSVMEVLKQQYTSCMKAGTGRNLDLSGEYHKKLFGPLFHSWWNCPLTIQRRIRTMFVSSLSATSIAFVAMEMTRSGSPNCSSKRMTLR